MAAAQETRLMALHALTFLHPGTGQTTGVVDLPVQREVHTGFPMIASSGLKGALREKAELAWKPNEEKVYAVFGPKESEAAGALALTDARILLLPVRSLQRVFFWVTCPMVLNRLSRDLEFAGKANGSVPKGVAVGKGKCIPPEGANLSGPVALEELRFEVEASAAKQKRCAGFVTVLKTIAPGLGDGRIDKTLLIIEDDDFSYLCRHALQVSARIALNEKKTTTGGGGNLWYEETLPPETVMYSILLANEPRYKPKPKKPEPSGETNSEIVGQGETVASAAGHVPQNAPDVMKEVDSLLHEQYLQVGGNETVGQGWCRVTLYTSLPPASGGTGAGAEQGEPGAAPSGGKEP